MYNAASLYIYIYIYIPRDNASTSSISSSSCSPEFIFFYYSFSPPSSSTSFASSYYSLSYYYFPSSSCSIIVSVQYIRCNRTQSHFFPRPLIFRRLSIPAKRLLKLLLGPSVRLHIWGGAKFTRHQRQHVKTLNVKRSFGHPAYNNSRTDKRIFTKFGTGIFYKKLASHFNYG